MAKPRYTISLNGPDASVELAAPPSVTTILSSTLPKGGLDWWGYRLGTEAAQEIVASMSGALPEGDWYELAKKRRKVTPYTELKAAGVRGTAVHEFVEALLRGEGAGWQDKDPLAGYYNAASKWYADRIEAHKTKVVAVEQTMLSMRHGFVGTCDAILECGGVYGVYDHKTSKAVYESHKLQLAAYEIAAREMGLVPKDAPMLNIVVRLGADGLYEEVPSHCTAADFECVLAMYRVLKGMQ